MKRVLTIAAALLVFAAPSFAQLKYGWTISSSASDPFVNSGPTSAAPFTLFLWYYCSTDDGMTAFEADITLPAGVLNFGFTPQNGYLNAGGAGNLLLAVGGCPTGPVVAGSWTFFGSTPGDICLVPSAFSGTRATVDCDIVVPHVIPIEAKGFDYGADGLSCDEDLCVVSVESSSWGSVKSLYR